MEKPDNTQNQTSPFKNEAESTPVSPGQDPFTTAVKETPSDKTNISPHEPPKQKNGKRYIITTIFLLAISASLVFAYFKIELNLSSDSLSEQERDFGTFSGLLQKIENTGSLLNSEESSELDQQSPINSNNTSQSTAPPSTTTPAGSTSTPTPISTPVPTPSPPLSNNVVSYTIDAKNFEFSLSSISASAGNTVRITLTNSGGNHDFVISEISGANTGVISQGEQVTIEFQIPNNPQGSYYYFCSVGNHRALGMEGTLVIN